MKNYFYFITQGTFLIADIGFCTKSNRTFDLPLFDIANNRKLLNKLNLHYMYNTHSQVWTFESRAEWFCGYLDAFSNHKKEGFYEKAISNPVVRLLIQDENLFNEISEILGK